MARITIQESTHGTFEDDDIYTLVINDDDVYVEYYYHYWRPGGSKSETIRYELATLKTDNPPLYAKAIDALENYKKQQTEAG